MLGGGSRQAYCPSSPAYARRRPGSPGSSPLRYGDASRGRALARQQRVRRARSASATARPRRRRSVTGCASRYGDLATLNDRWGAAFWSQRYAEWDEIDVPRTSTSVVNPAQRLDFARFSSDALLGCFRRERDILHELSPGIPVTTNFMANNCKSVDYWRWAPEVDVISNDNYLIAERTDSYLDLAMSADLSRSLAGGGSWLLMEHSDERGVLAAAERREAARVRCAATHWRTWPGARTGCCSSSGGPAGSARRSTTRRCCRRAARTPGSGARSSRSASELAGLAEPARHPGRAGHRDGLGLGVVVGAGAGVAAQCRPRLPGAGPGLVRGVLAGRADRRLRPPARRPGPLPPGGGACRCT